MGTHRRSCVLRLTLLPVVPFWKATDKWLYFASHLQQGERVLSAVPVQKLSCVYEATVCLSYFKEAKQIRRAKKKIPNGMVLRPSAAFFITAFTPQSPSKPGFVHRGEGPHENPLRSGFGTH